MVVRKKRKSVRMRGSKTHGYGSMKKHRGSGNRGGKGLAGTGKKADSKKPSIWKDKDYFGQRGFTSRAKLVRRVVIMTLSDVQRNIAVLEEKGFLREEDGQRVLDLEAAGVDRLLGSGRAEAVHGLVIRVPHATRKAVEKVEAAGGRVQTREEAA